MLGYVVPAFSTVRTVHTYVLAYGFDLHVRMHVCTYVVVYMYDKLSVVYCTVHTY